MNNVAATTLETPASQEYLSFSLGQQEYGIPILKVQEIRGFEKVTPIFQSPAFVLGVLNLRGVIIPVIDLRLRLGMPAAYTSFTAVIIVNLKGRVMGMVVDSVSDVLRANAEQISSPPQVSAVLNMQHVAGLITLNHQLVILLDIDSLLESSDPISLDAAALA